MPEHFTITNQEHSWIYDVSGTRTGQWTITFQTPGGYTSQVIVDDSAYTAHNVASLIGPLAQKIDEIGALQQGPA